jgi:hypothetical protein
LDDADADDLLDRLVDAEAVSLVSNGTPFGVTVEAAIIPGRQSAVADVFSMAGSLPLANINVPPATVDATGRVTQAANAELTVILNADQVRPFLGTDYTIGTRIRIMPGTGGGGRAALRSSDVVIVQARALISIRGGSE